ncbi:hypothetical protein [Nocardioides acrostichi]|uniref:DUF2273 domain-containing protein n=1 Tax=Nocardioides acrostichi TaxID=2784339 RepID=A0A930V1U5_9ACTN|nr:hypothetical protein [Nocardioides acrostichi]MBF4161659.1 hypothetical protein [Nocardioides acrostichi]
MPRSLVGLLVGLLLTLAITTEGFLGLLLAIVLGGGGLVVGRYLEGDVDLDALRGGGRRD